MNPKEKATWGMSIYNAQYDDYKFQVARLDLDEAQKDVLREKKKVLTEVYPVLMLYNGYAESGVLPPMETEVLMINLLTRLLELG